MEVTELMGRLSHARAPRATLRLSSLRKSRLFLNQKRRLHEEKDTPEETEEMVEGCLLREAHGRGFQQRLVFSLELGDGYEPLVIFFFYLTYSR